MQEDRCEQGLSQTNWLEWCPFYKTVIGQQQLVAICYVHSIGR